MSLWISSDYTNHPPHGYGWRVAAKDGQGFAFERSGSTLSSRAARRAVKRGEKAAKTLWRASGGER
jgi:hypothetical protein